MSEPDENGFRFLALSASELKAVQWIEPILVLVVAVTVEPLTRSACKLPITDQIAASELDLRSEPRVLVSTVIRLSWS